MIQVKAFLLEKYEEFNEFVKTTRPRGESGIKYTTTHIYAFYEDGVPMDALDQIASLKFDIGKHRENQLGNRKQALIQKRQLAEVQERQNSFVEKLDSSEGKEKYELEKLIKAGEEIIAQYEQKISADEGASKLEETTILAIQDLIKEIESE